MDVLIVERDLLVGSVLTDALDAEGISVAVLPDDEALKLTPALSPQVVITSMNRGHGEDCSGLDVVAAMRRKLPGLCAIYLAAIWPARLPRWALAKGERFLEKPVGLAMMVRAVRELLNSNYAGRQDRHHERLSSRSANGWWP